MVLRRYRGYAQISAPWFMEVDLAKKPDIAKIIIKEVFPRFWGAFEDKLALKEDNKLFLVGGSLTIADFLLTDCLSSSLKLRILRNLH